MRVLAAGVGSRSTRPPSPTWVDGDMTSQVAQLSRALEGARDAAPTRAPHVPARSSVERVPCLFDGHVTPALHVHDRWPNGPFAVVAADPFHIPIQHK